MSQSATCWFILTSETSLEKSEFQIRSVPDEEAVKKNGI